MLQFRVGSGMFNRFVSCQVPIIVWTLRSINVCSYFTTGFRRDKSRRGWLATPIKMALLGLIYISKRVTGERCEIFCQLNINHPVILKKMYRFLPGHPDCSAVKKKKLETTDRQVSTKEHKECRFASWLELGICILLKF